VKIKGVLGRAEEMGKETADDKEVSRRKAGAGTTREIKSK
jgi:hypothetical protein